jgi:hypothetical protein
VALALTGDRAGSSVDSSTNMVAGMDHRAELLRLVHRVAQGGWPVPEFERAYGEYWVEDLPDGALSEADSAFFEAIQEKLQWTGRDPSAESRQSGWIDYEEFRTWVTEQLAEHLRQGEG